MSFAIEGMDSILRMPSGCFEQVSSSLYPDIMVLEYLESLGSNDENDNLKTKAKDYINVGYQKLLTYEVPGEPGGFSLYGRPKAETVLTAYGLMELKDLSKVYDIDEKVLKRMEKFLESQTTKQNEFDLAQTNRDKDFTLTQEEQQSVFEENETHREQIFEEMKNIAYDENAVLKNRKLINSKIDEIEFEEQVLELVRDPETGRITGSIGGDRIHFYTNVINEDGTTAKEKVAEHLIVGRQSTYAGTEEPIDVEKIWYDLSD